MKLYPFIATAFLLFLCEFNGLSQDDDYFQSLLTEEVEIENPIYMPVIGIGYGHLNFMGDIKNDYNSPLIGQTGFRVTMTTFFENSHAYRLNFFFLSGSLTGTQKDYVDLYKNLNFKTSILNFGLNIDYNFKNLLPPQSKISPYVAGGIGFLIYSPKTDIFQTKTINGEIISKTYNYWSDGTIRNIPESEKNLSFPQIIERDYSFETDLRKLDRFNKGAVDNTYNSSYGLAIPVEAGIDFKVSERVFLRIGYAFNYTLTDYMDDLGGTDNYIGSRNYGGNSFNDTYSYLYASLHLDLFSSPKTVMQERFFLDLEFDETMLDDNDNDIVLDANDECLKTPFGVAVDSVGCPFDDDKDGVPNYLDLELNSAPNAMVDENGITYDINVLISKLDFSDAVSRSEVDIILANYNSGGKKNIYKNRIVPQRFKTVDKDDDGYVSFEEILKEINNFFDFNSTLKTQDIYDLNRFFFDQ